MVRGANYRGSFLFSPFPSARIRVPLNWRQTLSFGGVGVIDLGLNWRYSALNPGAFVEVLVEYDQPIVRGAFVTFWWKGRWLRIRGEADLDTAVNLGAFGVQIPYPTVSSPGVATYTDYSIAGGLKAVIPF